MAIRVFLSVVLLALVAAAGGCLPAASALDFSVQPGCVQGMDGYSPPREGVLEMNWVTDSTLQVAAFAKTFCGGAQINGSYQLDQEGKLVLGYKVTTAGPVTTCNCPHRLTYRIAGLSKGNYDIAVMLQP